MSGEGPESIPTSADPRSKRPTKKRALSPTSAQASIVSSLFAKPDQPVRIPSTSTSSTSSALRSSRAPPEIVTNVQGSSAGAGSGEFHVYKASRRREYERLRAMDAEVARETGDAEFERGRAERERRDGERTRRNREKREKKKKRAVEGKSKVTAAAGEEEEGGGDKSESAAVRNNNNNKNGDNGGSATTTTKKVKARIDLRKNNEEDASKESTDGKGEPGQNAGDKPAEEPKGIVIEDD